MPHDDLFEDLFTLEDDLYNQGYQEGTVDGQKKARLEAYIFGIEQGFAKFKEMGALQAKAQDYESLLRGAGSETSKVAAGSRVAKHLETLKALVDPETLSFDNSDEAVADFDDRLKRANAKVTVIEKILGTESTANKPASATGLGKAARAMEDFGR